MSESSQNQSSQAPSPTNETNSEAPIQKNPWWKSIGPALITACVVFGPGSLVISSKVGATYGYEMLWLLILNGLLMGTFLTMSARIGVVGGATPCQLLAKHANRPIAFITGLTLCWSPRRSNFRTIWPLPWLPGPLYLNNMSFGSLSA